MTDLRERWLAGEGRLGAQKGPQLVCWRCGASQRKGAPLSGCTEKRGTGQPWAHEYFDPELVDPWRDLPTMEILSLATYLQLKATGSLATVETWTAMWTEGQRDGQIGYAIALYREKAEKRARLLGWALDVLERRLAAEKGAP